MSEGNKFVEHLRSELAENKHGLVIVDTMPGRGAVAASKEALGPGSMEIEVAHIMGDGGLVEFSATLNSASAKGIPVVVCMQPTVDEADALVILADVKGFVDGGGRAILVTYDGLKNSEHPAIQHSRFFEVSPEAASKFAEKLSAGRHARKIAEMRAPPKGPQSEA